MARGLKEIARKQEVFRLSKELKILEVICSECGAVNQIRYAIIRDEPVKCEECRLRADRKKTEIDAKLGTSQAHGRHRVNKQDHETADYAPRQALSQPPLVHVEAQAHSHNCEDCADVIRNPEVMERLIAKYLASKLALPPEFVAWFRERPHNSVVKLSEILDAYEQFKRERSQMNR